MGARQVHSVHLAWRLGLTAELAARGAPSMPWSVGGALGSHSDTCSPGSSIVGVQHGQLPLLRATPSKFGGPAEWSPI